MDDGLRCLWGVRLFNRDILRLIFKAQNSFRIVGTNAMAVELCETLIYMYVDCCHIRTGSKFEELIFESY